MAITVDSLPPRPKCGYDGGYDVAVKGPSVVVSISSLHVAGKPFKPMMIIDS